MSGGSDIDKGSTKCVARPSYKGNTFQLFRGKLQSFFVVDSEILNSKKGRNYTGCFTTLGHNSGGDFLGLCDEKSSYKHVSEFEQLRSYDRLKLRIEGNDY